ncbi:MAG: EAL domain-containing protein [Woeseiaceae bacterium]
MRPSARQRKFPLQCATWRVLALWAALVLSFGVTAHAQTSRLQPMVFSHLDIEDGLSQGTVTEVFQDQLGFIWLGTESGLNRYDGNDVERFVQDRRNQSALVNDFIWDIADDASGDIWVATDGGGVSVYDQATGTFSHHRHDPSNENSISSDTTRSVLVDRDGIVWIGTRDAGLNRLDRTSNSIIRYTLSNPNLSVPPTATVFDIIQAIDGGLWFATNEGLYHKPYGNQTMRRYDSDNGLSGDTAITVVEDSDGLIWIGTYENGLNALNLKTGVIEHFRHDPENSNSIAGNYIRDLMQDNNGRLWAATSQGLSLYCPDDHGGFDNYRKERTNPTGLASSYVMDLFQDSSGILWVGTRGAGVAMWSPRSWSLGLTQAPELVDSMITAFAADGAGTLWIGTMGAGLQQYSTETGELVPAAELFDQDIANIRTMSLLLDSRGHLWIGTMAQGLLALDLDTGSIRRFKHDPDDPESLSTNGIMSIFEDQDGSVWAGTFGGGLNQINVMDGRVRRISVSGPIGDTFSRSRITAITQDHLDRLWLATDGDGVFSYQINDLELTQYLTSETDTTTISENRLYAIFFDTDSQRLWAGTAGRGLDWAALGDTLQTEIRFNNFSKANGLSDNVIYGIERGNDGHLWFSTNNGLINFEWSTKTVHTLHRRHGLQGEEFNFGAHHRGPDGQLFFGGANGFNAFHPDQFEASGTAPRVRISSIHINSTPYSTDGLLANTQTLELPHDQNIIAVEASVLHFVDPARNLISYFLEGFDTQWSEPGTDKRFTYTNLDSGSYTLRIRGVSSSGIESESPVSLTIVIKPAPWATWWAYLIYVLSVALTIFLGMRWYHRRINKHARIKRLAESDPLTGLCNRNRFMDLVIAAGQQYSSMPNNVVVVAIDFNHIKRVNDSFGHESGDLSLKALGNRLIHLVAEAVPIDDQSETARLSGDEFSVLLTGNSAISSAHRLAEQIIAQFSESIVNGNTRVNLPTSVGIAIGSTNEMHALLKNAQAASHAARASEQSSFLVHSEDIAKRLKQRVSLEQEIRHALDRDEYRLYLQPKFDTKSQVLIGAEALIRWEHPEKGLIPPDIFIPIAEEAGLITDIGEWVIEQSARRIHYWQTQEQPVVPIAVNLSGVEFRSSSPAHTISEAAKRVGIDVTLLQVELTESVVMHDVKRARKALKEIRNLGCQLSIDDFGTGYSSLAYLKRFPLDTLKIDRAFINDITESDEDRSICEAIIAMAHGLDLTVVAEGVETEAQMQCLLALGCDQVQGYFMGKPVPEEKFAAFFSARAAVPGSIKPQPFIKAG